MHSFILNWIIGPIAGLLFIIAYILYCMFIGGLFGAIFLFIFNHIPTWLSITLMSLVMLYGAKRIICGQWD